MSFSEEKAARGATRVRGRRKPVLREIASPGTGDEAALEMPAVRRPRFGRKRVSITERGAVGDGKTACTRAIAAAIDVVAEAGGGMVIVPAGEWLTGAIHLKSNVELRLEKGAKLRFSGDPGEYEPAVFVRWSGQECFNYSPLIYARGARNIGITGEGEILGGGGPWWEWAKRERKAQQRLNEMAAKGVAVQERRFGCEEHPLRPQLVGLMECEDVLLEGFAITEGGPFWTVHLAYSTNVTVRELRIDTSEGPNNDGIVIDSSRNVVIEDCAVKSADDCVALKSGMNEDGRRVGRATENVVVRRVRALGGAGGIAIGSDMSGGVRNVLVHDCECDGVAAGIRFKATRGRGGVVEDVRVQDLRMGHIAGSAIEITCEYPVFTMPAGEPPTFRNVRISNVVCADAKAAVKMAGLPDRGLEQFELRDLAIAAERGLELSCAKCVKLVNVKITPRSGPVLAVRDSQDVTVDGLNAARGASVFLDVRGRQTRNIVLKGEAKEQVRPAVVLGVDVPKGALVHE